MKDASLHVQKDPDVWEQVVMRPRFLLDLVK